MNPFFSSLAGQLSLGPQKTEFLSVVGLMAHSVVLGILLGFLTYYSATHMSKEREKGAFEQQLLLSSFNILFLCVGLTGVMILVNNNLARAFAIGASLALVRFRIKMGSKSTASHLLFGILAGIACGLDEVSLAWLIASVYTLLQMIMIFLVQRLQAKHSSSK